MNITNEEFKEKIITKYLQDINNIYMIQDYIVLENNEECENMLSEIAKEEYNDNISNKKTKGAFSFLLDEKYLLISKNDELKNAFKIIHNYLLSINKKIEENKDFILTNIKSILSLINLDLIFNDNVTFYSLKKKILKKDLKNIDELILSEYYFTCTKNKKGRKSLISWDYKYFLYQNFKDNIKPIKKDNQSFYILDLLKEELNLLGIKHDIFYNNEFILNDLEINNEVNIIQSRNYHMWTYLRKVFNDTNKEGKILILLYAFYILRKCSFDYSAFCFIVNSKNNMPLEKEQLKLLIEKMKKNNFIKYEEHKCYINDIDKFIFN